MKQMTNRELLEEFGESSHNWMCGEDSQKVIADKLRAELIDRLSIYEAMKENSNLAIIDTEYENYTKFVSCSDGAWKYSVGNIFGLRDNKLVCYSASEAMAELLKE